MFEETDDDATTGGMALARAQLKVAGGNRASEAPSRPPAPRGASDSSRPAATVLGAKAKHLGKAAATSRPGKPSAASTARDRLKSTFNPRSFVALGSEKRDVRTIEEIECDMRLKKGGGKCDSDRPASRATPAASTSRLPPPSTDKRKLSGDEQRARDVAKRRRLDDANGSSSKETRRDRSDSDDSGDDSDDSDDRRRRRRKAKDKHGSGLDDSSRQEIWKLFGRDRQADVRRDAFSDDSDDDMEVSPEALRREEQRACVRPTSLFTKMSTDCFLSFLQSEGSCSRGSGRGGAPSTPRREEEAAQGEVSVRPPARIPHLSPFPSKHLSFITCSARSQLATIHARNPTHLHSWFSSSISSHQISSHQAIGL